MFQVVVPTGQEVGGDLDLVVLSLGSVGLPVVVVGGVIQQRLDPGTVHHLIQGGVKGEPREDLVPVHQGMVENAGPEGHAPVDPEELGHEDHVQLGDAVVVEVTEVGLLIGARHQGFQVGMLVTSRHHLCEAVVGMPEGPDLPVAPVLLGQPLLSVESVLRGH